MESPVSRFRTQDNNLSMPELINIQGEKSINISANLPGKMFPLPQPRLATEGNSCLVFLNLIPQLITKELTVLR